MFFGYDIDWPVLRAWLPAWGPVITGTATLIVGLIVAGVAIRQWRTAENKLAVDLFDRRLIAYKAFIKAVEDREAEIKRYEPSGFAQRVGDIAGMEFEGPASGDFERAKTEIHFLFGMDVYVIAMILGGCLSAQFKATRKLTKDGVDHFDDLMAVMEQTRVSLIEFRKAATPYMMLDRIGKTKPVSRVSFSMARRLQNVWRAMTGRWINDRKEHPNLVG